MRNNRLTALSRGLMLIILLLSFSCVRNYQFENGSSNKDDSLIIPFEDAQAALENFVAALDPATKDGKKTREIEDGFIRMPATKTSTEEYPLIYAFNFKNDEGYALVSGDKRMPRILCVIDKGHLNNKDNFSNDGPRMLLANLETMCRVRAGLTIIDSEGIEHYLPELKVEAPMGENGDRIITPSYEVVGRHGSLIDCSWGQGSPFNAECYQPNGNQGLAGCVPVAVGQIMYHWGKNYTYNNYYYDWSVMHDVTTSSSMPSNPTAWPGVQHLLYTLGLPANLDATYGPTGTSASQYNVPRTFQHFGFSSGGSIENYSSLETLSSVEDGPILMIGYSKRKIIVDEGGNEQQFLYYTHGHAWVIDRVIEVNEYIGNLPIPRLSFYSHCNWGWNGMDNGYYLNGVFDSNTPTGIYDVGNLPLFDPIETKSDTVEVGTNYYYQYALQMNDGIRANTY